MKIAVGRTFPTRGGRKRWVPGSGRVDLSWEASAVLYQVIQAGWLHEIEAPAGCHIARTGPGKPLLVIPGAYGAGQDEYLAPRVVVRAAKDHLFGLSRVRSWPIAPEAARPETMEAIIELQDA